MRSVKTCVAVLGLVILVAGCGSEGEGDYLDRMSKEHAGDAPVENGSSDVDTAQVSGEEVTYATVSGNEITGYLAKGDFEGESPGIIVIHEWWGLNDNIRAMADKLAGEGYTALAVDLYEGSVAETPDSAKVFAGSVQEKQAIENLTQAYSYLENRESVTSIGSIGWCFGGGWSLKTALAYPEKIDATVIYYGQLVTDPRQLKDLEMPVLGIFGAEDEGIPVDQVKEFESALNEVDVENSIHIYEGAGHAFANPSGERYQQEAAEDAWQKTINFLNTHLKQKDPND